MKKAGRPNSKANETLAQLRRSPMRFAGGCADCDAYITTRADDDWMIRLTVHHDDTCPTLARVRGAR
jgi:hypothetical protein